MPKGYWYYPSDKYKVGADRDIDSDETEYDTDLYLRNYVPMVEESKGNWEYVNPFNRITIKKFYSKKPRKPIPAKQRQLVLELYEHKCVRCGDKQNLEVHHINGNPSDNRRDNLEALCFRCHKKTHKKAQVDDELVLKE